MELQEARDYDMGWWVFARILVFVSILLLILWSGFSSECEPIITFQIQANGRRPINFHSNSVKQLLSKEPDSVKQLLSKEPELLEIMKNAALFMVSQIYTTPETPRKTVKLVTLSFEDSISLPLVIIKSNIYMSSKYIIESYEGINGAKAELERLIYTAMAHVWLWNGKGDAPLGLMGAMANLLTSFAGFKSLNIENLAKNLYANYGANYIEDEGHIEQWTWSLWDYYHHHEEQPLTTSFLAFCEASKPGFLSALNSKLEHGWNQSYFQDLMNRNVDDLWADYKALMKLHTSSTSPPTIIM